MLERSRFCDVFSVALPAGLAAATLLLGACATTEPPQPVPAPSSAAAAPAPAPAVDPKALAAEARALLAQAETDIQRARARRALWAKAWEALVSARAAIERGDSALAIREARVASELAQLGLEQVAYPAVTQQATRAGESADPRLRSPP
jgi:hypothetical protein